MQLTEKQAKAVFNVLMRHCGAKPSQRADFLYHAQREQDSLEYRFQGRLGFGGKVYLDRDKWRVNCYAEDQTPERADAIRLANAELAALWRYVHTLSRQSDKSLPFADQGNSSSMSDLQATIAEMRRFAVDHPLDLALIRRSIESGEAQQPYFRTIEIDGRKIKCCLTLNKLSDEKALWHLSMSVADSTEIIPQNMVDELRRAIFGDADVLEIPSLHDDRVRQIISKPQSMAEAKAEGAKSH